MITVSARNFRSNQKSYLDKAALGTDVLILRRNEAFKLSKVSEDDTIFGKEDFLAKVERAIADVKEGKTFAMEAGESLDAFMDRMERKGNV